MVDTAIMYKQSSWYARVLGCGDRSLFLSYSEYIDVDMKYLYDRKGFYELALQKGIKWNPEHENAYKKLQIKPTVSLKFKPVSNPSTNEVCRRVANLILLGQFG